MSATPLKLRRTKAKAAITRAYTAAQTIAMTATVEELEARLANLSEAWQQFQAIDDALCDFEEISAEEAESYVQYEEKYIQASAAYTHAIRAKEVKPQPELKELKKKGDVSLPKIIIPSFSGDYAAWKSFRDIYVGSVGNKDDLTLTQKFYYLVSFLSGEAADLIRHIPITEECFPQAWKKLEERYDRPHLIARSYIKKFLQLSSTSTSAPKAIRKIIDGADECIRGLAAIKMDGRDPWLIYLLLTKLDDKTRQAWFEEIGARTDVTFDICLEFLDKRFIHLESSELLSAGNKQSTIRSHTAETTSSSCPLCNQSHNISKCPEFIAKSESDRRKVVSDKRLCFNCLKQGHQSRNCKSTYKCRICNFRHHTLVHFAQQSDSNNQVGINNASKSLCTNTPEDIATSNFGSSYKTNIRVVMPTAVVWTTDKNDKIVKLRVLLDTGSEVSLITEACAQLIGSTRFNARLTVKGIGTSEAGSTKGLIHVKLYSCINQSHVQAKAYILPQVTSKVPATDTAFNSWEKLKGLKLADSKFNIAAPIDILLGADIVWSLLRNGRIHELAPSLMAVNTMFGWVVSGEVPEASGSSSITSYSTLVDIDRLMSRFWDLDECKPMPALSNHDDPAEIHFRETHTRVHDGRYTVELPFKTPNPQFGDTITGAVQRLYAMERRFVHSPTLKQEYSKFIQDYITLGHMDKIAQSEIEDEPKYYLPHHAVFKPDSSTTKLRVVFDGSHKDSAGKSLNEALMIGPPIQRDLFGVAIRFRQHAYVFTADITKMFRQIWVATHHQDYQRIVWRDNTGDQIQHFRLRTVTYGTASAPFHSVRVLQQLALDNQTRYPCAAEIILNHIYVDDVMAGGKSADELFKMKAELVELLNSGGFKLRKWYSNSPTFLEIIPTEDRERVIKNDDTNCIKILGLYWKPDTDSYSFRVNESPCKEITKRHILSEVAKIFDIFGFLAPVVVKVKIMLQTIWQMQMDWDTPLPESIKGDWLKIKGGMNVLQNVNTPRQVHTHIPTSEIHIFCDASTDAYAAVIYSVLRSTNSTDVRLIAAKTRVAPLKAVSVPRLELCAALLGARLYKSIKMALNLDNENVFAWTDSQLVIHYLSAPPRKWKMFVSNRCEEILDILPRVKWRHVRTSDNPADCASRGIYPEELLNHKLWWRGPTWLADESEARNEAYFPSEITEDRLEVRSVNAHPVVMEPNNAICISLLKRFSSFNKVVRIVAYLLRANPQRRKHPSEHCPNLTCQDLHAARMKLYAAIQQDFCSRTITSLKQGIRSKGDPLLKLAPFLDETQVLRVGGRIKDASISYDAKHPIILPKCDFTTMIIKELHEKYLHAGAAHLFFLVRQQFWVLGARNLMRKIVHTCKRCFMQRKTTSEQLMGNLPACRINPARAFLNSGCDFAGPITIKMTNHKKPRMCKAYICLFICMSTKAIHIELATDLTSEAFISAFMRFTARRGRCSNLYSDNGTNFHGAHRLLTNMHKLLLDETLNKDIHTSLANDGTTWNFIPPSSPHFGGIWESNIKSIKLHLNRVIGEHLLSYDELNTVLIQIEALLNSRPLCYASDSDINPITPAHFLVGDALTIVPTPVNNTAKWSLASHFNWLRNMVQGFWKRWHLEYLSSLQPRAKWNQDQRNYVVGDIVVLKEPNMPPSKWLLGKVIETHPGPDGRVRVVTIKTEHAVYKRPIVKIALLPCV